MLQMRMSADDSRLYNPSRDIAHCYPAVFRIVRERLLGGHPWSDVRDVVKPFEVTDEMLGDAVDRFADFLVTAVDDPKEDMRAALLRSGWFELSPAARVAVMATLGNALAGVFWNGVRSATLGGIGPLDQLAHLRGCCGECAAMMAMPRWRRVVYGWRLRLRRAFAALRGRDE